MLTCWDVRLSGLMVRDDVEDEGLRFLLILYLSRYECAWKIGDEA